MSSILTTIKKRCGIDEDYEVFDQEIIMAINSTFSTLRQLGVGPEKGFRIENKETLWEDYLGDDEDRLSYVVDYVYLKVRLIFDPPTNSFVQSSFQDQIKELEWRINVDVDPGLEEDDEEEPPEEETEIEGD